MFVVLRPTYTVMVTIKQPPIGHEGLTPFWAEVVRGGKTGCDDVLATIRKALTEAGLGGVDLDVRLSGYAETA